MIAPSNPPLKHILMIKFVIKVVSCSKVKEIEAELVVLGL